MNKNSPLNQRYICPIGADGIQCELNPVPLNAHKPMIVCSFVMDARVSKGVLHEGNPTDGPGSDRGGIKTKLRLSYNFAQFVK